MLCQNLFQGFSIVAPVAAWVQGLNRPLEAISQLDQTVRFNIQARKAKLQRDDASRTGSPGIMMLTGPVARPNYDQVIDVNFEGRPLIRSWKEFTEVSGPIGIFAHKAARLLGRFENLLHALWAVTYLDQDIEYSIERAQDGAFRVYAGDENSGVGGVNTLLHTHLRGIALPSLGDLSTLSQAFRSDGAGPSTTLIFSKPSATRHEISCITALSPTRFEIIFRPDAAVWANRRHFTAEFDEAPPFNPLHNDTRHFPTLSVAEQSSEGRILKRASYNPQASVQTEQAFWRSFLRSS